MIAFLVNHFYREIGAFKERRLSTSLVFGLIAKSFVIDSQKSSIFIIVINTHSILMFRINLDRNYNISHKLNDQRIS